MTCFFPLDAQILDFGGSKKVKVLTKGSPYKNAELPCGRCKGCRIEKSREWAIRCVHEASMYEDNSFVTLTYAPEHLPFAGSLVPDHLSKFIRSLRKKTGQKIRYFGCGEYGSEHRRPHYHCILFGFDFADKYVSNRRNGYDVFRSEFLESVWVRGSSEIGSFTFKSAAYVARYCMKKQTGPLADTHYEVVLPDGRMTDIVPEFVRCSNRPGIGKPWFDQFYRDCYPKDFVTHRGKKFRIPRYYDKLYRSGVGKRAWKLIEKKRQLNQEKFCEENTPDRLRQKRECAERRFSNLPRPFEA